MGAVHQALLMANNSGVIVGTDALVYKTGTQTIGAFAAVTYQNEVYDTGNIHDSSSNTSRLNVPAATSLCRIVACNQFSGSAPFQSRITKNGSLFYGSGLMKAQGGGTWAQAVSGIIAPSPGDYFEVQGDADVAASDFTWAGFETIDASTKYCLVRKSTTQSITGGAGAAALTFDTEIADVGGWHDNVTNNTRMTVPSGVTRVRLSGGFETTTTGAGKTTLLFAKNGGAAVEGTPRKDQEGGTVTGNLCAASAILEVTAGDYFELKSFCANTRTIAASENTWFCIEEVPNYNRALVKKSANQSITNAVEVAIAWDSEVYDADSFHDNVTNNSRLTVPAGLGITQARVSFGISTPSTVARTTARVTKNGSSFQGAPKEASDTSGVDNLAGFGPWVSATAGDYFECLVLATASYTLAANINLWFAIECR